MSGAWRVIATNDYFNWATVEGPKGYGCTQVPNDQAEWYCQTLNAALGKRHARPAWQLVERCRHCEQTHDDALGACWGALHDAWGHFPLGCDAMGCADRTSKKQEAT